MFRLFTEDYAIVIFMTYVFTGSITNSACGQMRTSSSKHHYTNISEITAYSAVSTRSKIECGKICMMMSNCFGSNFNVDTRECRLVTQVVTSLSDSPSPSEDIIKVTEAKRCTNTQHGYCRDCSDLRNSGYTDTGVYFVYIDGQSALPVNCDMETAGGGWTIFQQRFDGSVDFFLQWNDYENGFGNVDIGGEYWLGLKWIHLLTTLGTTEMYTDLEAFDGVTVYAQYSSFSVQDASTDYQIAVTGYSGTAGDGMIDRNDRFPFSTRDNEQRVCGKTCANNYRGAWWYGCTCHWSNLNGFYFSAPGTHVTFADGINWEPFRGLHESMKRTKIMIRRVG